MEMMKWDMGGAGAVAGAMMTLAARKARANVIGVCTLAETCRRAPPPGPATS
jgi:leucyl aminopeptidase